VRKGPSDHLGFSLSETNDGDLLIGSGRYHVDGILIENEDHVSYLLQPDYPMPYEDALPCASVVSLMRFGLTMIVAGAW